jgi:hypothetical protein
VEHGQPLCAEEAHVEPLHTARGANSPRCRESLVLALFCAAVSWSSSAQAGGGAATDAYEDVEPGAVFVSGLADVYLLYNANAPISGTNQLRWSDFVSDSASLNFARLTVAHRPGRFGARLDFGVGDMADVFLAADPESGRYRGLARWLSFIEQAFVTVVVPELLQLTFDLGKFDTPVGLEDNETPPNWNYSRSFLFTWGEPTLQTGIRATFAPRGDKLGVTVFWVNGWNTNILDGNDMRSLGAAATWHPREGTEIALVYLGGLERQPTQLSNPALSFRSIVSAYVLEAVGSSVMLGLTADYAHDAALGGVDWGGVAGYAQLHFCRWLTGALRTEYYADPEGFTTGTPQHLVEATATLSASASIRRATLVVRLEYRHDQSDVRVFEGHLPRTLSHQDTLTLALVGSY